ncbi:MAG: secretion system protein [Actinophytocola sp.]|uniref:type II secretion system F family protein n=1 Tax=Actinophytocola sp. TaxID=1872138 RepID=UPI00132B5C22|nr:type II secretion system F family protein [Actinophytocola sp.]MPZ82055.1 secretion system protein [Actinophytocola sp.]
MVSLLCCALALLTWAGSPAATRLRNLDLVGTRHHRRLGPPRPSSVTLTTAAAVAGWLMAGVGGAIAAALATVTVWRRWRARGQLHRSLSAIDGLTEALRSLVAGLRAGAHPAEAAEAAAADAQPHAAAPMRAIAAAARLDGDVQRALDGTQTLAGVLARVSRAWALAQRHGLPLADVLDAVGRDLDQRVRFARQVLARMAGPRTSATTLALLPVLGIGLGEAMGAHPLRVLTGPGLGQVLLVIGIALLCAGVAWCGRLTGQVVPS